MVPARSDRLRQDARGDGRRTGTSELTGSKEGAEENPVTHEIPRRRRSSHCSLIEKPLRRKLKRAAAGPSPAVLESFLRTAGITTGVGQVLRRWRAPGRHEEVV